MPSPTRLPKTVVYIDGFNFYYAAFKNGPYGAYRWLDLKKFCDFVLRRNDVRLIRYFTARVSPLPWDPDQSTRQEAYLSALTSLRRVEVHEGSFYIRQTLRALVDRPDSGSRWVKVWNPEEKGSDVNLATYLVRDGFTGEYDVAVVVSDDSDLLEPVRVVRRELARPVGVVNVRERRSVFRRDADFFIRPVKWHFEESQLPPTVLLPQGGQVDCPSRWLAARSAADSAGAATP
jgi:hypothetical protein